MKSTTTLLVKLSPIWHVRPGLLCMLLLAFLFSSACSKDDPVPEKPISQEPGEEPIDVEAKLVAFNTAVNSLSNFENPDIIDPPAPVSADDPVEDGNYLCTIKRYKAAPEYNEMLMLNSNSQELYPGALIKGESILAGTYEAISGERKPITISTSLTNLDGPVSSVVEDPANVSEVRQAISDILSAGVIGNTPAELTFSIESVYSEQQLNAFMGANYSGATVDASGSFDFSSTNTESKIVIKFIQKYFSIDIDKIDKPSDLFSETNLPDIASLGATIPNYISSVNYGRMVLFTASSSYSNTEMEAAFQASYNAAVSEGGGELESRYQKILNNSTIQAFVLGGDGEEAVRTVTGVEGVKSYILTGGNYSQDSPGAPLSYTLKNIKDNTISNVVLATEYTARECQKVSSNFRITLTEIDCSGGVNDEGDQQMYGYIHLAESNIQQDDITTTCGSYGPEIGWFWGYYTDNYYQTATANKITVGTSFDFTLPLDGSYVFLSGHLYEYDLYDIDPDEDLGASCKKLELADLQTPLLELPFNGDGDTAKAVFTITPLD